MGRFFILDVFAERRHAGNQLAVILGTDRSDDEMQSLAREMAFSETTFVGARDAGGSWPVRIFTPAVEVPFAGHPTIGTAIAIREKLAQSPLDAVVLKLKAGDVPVRFGADGVGWMTPPTPTWGEHHKAETIATFLGLEPGDIDTRFPVQDMQVGVAFTMVPLRSLDAVRRARWSEQHAACIRTSGVPRGVFLFAAEAVEAGNHAHARMLAPDHGVAEDPATGSANTCFAHYIREHGFLPADIDVVRVEQGYEMLRPSLLRLKTSLPVEVGGRAVFSAVGELVEG